MQWLVMVKKHQVFTAYRRGDSRLTIAGVVRLVEAMHCNIASVPGILATPKRERTPGITRLAYPRIHGVIGLVRHGLD